jgi:hypothetical protein
MTRKNGEKATARSGDILDDVRTRARVHDRGRAIPTVQTKQPKKTRKIWNESDDGVAVKELGLHSLWTVVVSLFLPRRQSSAVYNINVHHRNFTKIHRK